MTTRLLRPIGFVVLIGLPFGFDRLPVTTFLIWIISVDSVCWKTNLVFGPSLCIWITCIAQICVCKDFFIKLNRVSLHGSWLKIPDSSCLIALFGVYK